MLDLIAAFVIIGRVPREMMNDKRRQRKINVCEWGRSWFASIVGSQRHKRGSLVDGSEVKSVKL